MVKLKNKAIYSRTPTVDNYFENVKISLLSVIEKKFMCTFLLQVHKIFFYILLHNP